MYTAKILPVAFVTCLRARLEAHTAIYVMSDHRAIYEQDIRCWGDNLCIVHSFRHLKQPSAISTAINLIKHRQLPLHMLRGTSHSVQPRSMTDDTLTRPHRGHFFSWSLSCSRKTTLISTITADAMELENSPGWMIALSRRILESPCSINWWPALFLQKPPTTMWKP